MAKVCVGQWMFHLCLICMFNGLSLITVPVMANPLETQQVSGINSTKADLQVSEGIAEGIYYKTFGQGQPVLIINGGPGLDSAGFESVAKTIAAKGFQTILFDQRGTGRSSLAKIDSHSIQMALMVEDIEKLRRHLDLPTLNILGHSFGGMLGAAYAAKYPQYVEKLIFSSAGGLDLSFREGFAERFNAKLTLVEQTKMQAYQALQAAGDDSAATRDALALIRAQAYVVDKSKAPAIAARLKVVNMTINSLVFADLEKINFDLKASFQDFNAPVLVLQGQNDIISVDTAQAISKSFKDAHLVLLPNCAHYGWLDNPKLYYASIFEFLQG